MPITAANAIGQSSAILTLAIAAAPPAPSLADSNLAASAALGATGVFYRISATNNPTSYSAANLPPGLTLDTVNGVISGTAAAAGVYAATISAANAGGSASAVATITVNSAAPVFVSTAATLTGTVGITLYSSLSASNYPTNYALSDLPPGLYFNPALAQISGTPSAAGIYQVSCTASNAAGSTAATLTFVVSPPKPPIFSSVFSSYYDTTVGGLFSEVMFSSSNNIMTYSASGLPPGIACITDSLTADLRGSPQVAGVYPVTIVASNGDGATATMRLVINVKPVSVTVNAPTTAPLITSSASVSGVAGSAFSYQISGSGSPTGFTASGLPDSLSVNAATGLISGTPQQAGSFPVAISAANAVGTANAVVTLVIASTAPPVNVVPLITSPATRMVQASTASGSLYLLSPTAAFSYPIQATGSPSAYSASGLPPGLSLNPNSGLISGRPGAPGTYRVNVTATNAAGTGAATLTLVAPPFAPTFSGAVLEMAGVVGMSLSSSISSLTVTSLSSLTHLADGSNYVTFTASGLPPGLSINPGTGQITGQPTRAGVYPTTLSLNGSTNAVTYLTTFAISASAAGVGLPEIHEPRGGAWVDRRAV